MNATIAGSAIEPHDPEVKVFPVASPLQCPALDYGSSFSRAVEVQMPDHRRLLISGTASIEPGGRTIHVGDVEKQIEMTMKVVEAILASRSMSWDDTAKAIAYIKQGRDAEMFRRYCVAHNLTHLPEVTVITENDVCRDDLLFEIELDAVTSS